MDNWRDYILKHFQAPVHRLTLVADPDGLLLEETLLAAIRRNGFHLLAFEDPVAFRYVYEAEYRQHWDDDRNTDLVVTLRAPSAISTLARPSPTTAGRSCSIAGWISSNALTTTMPSPSLPACRPIAPASRLR